MFCKFLVWSWFWLFFCQAMALLVLPEKKENPSEKKYRKCKEKEWRLPYEKEIIP